MAGINRSQQLRTWYTSRLLRRWPETPHPPPAGCWKFDVEVVSFVQTFRERDTGYWIACCFHKLDCNGSGSRSCKGTRSSECAAATQLGLCIIQHTLWKKTSWFWFLVSAIFRKATWPSTKKKGNHLKLNSPGYIQTLGSVLCPFHLWCGTSQTPRWSSFLCLKRKHLIFLHLWMLKPKSGTHTKCEIKKVCDQKAVSDHQGFSDHIM